MLGDTSDKGAKESATLMVNYLYDPAKIEDWHEDYAGEGKRNASTAVRQAGAGMELKGKIMSEAILPETASDERPGPDASGCGARHLE